jgi:phytoene dehydrogenase-like protein
MQAGEVVVVGAGLAGLAAAITAAKRGGRTIVLEAASETGGRARSQQRGSATFNLGPHALYRAGEAYTFLGELGIGPAGGSPDVSGLAIRNGTLGTLPAGVWSLLRSNVLSLGGKVAFARHMPAIPRVDPGPLAGVSTAEWVRRTFRDESAREAVLALCRLATYSADAEAQSAGAALMQLGRALSQGVMYPDGGWSSIVTALESAAVRAGVTIERGVPVTEVTRTPGGEWRVVTRGGGEHTARAVVLAVPPAVAADLVPGAQAPALRRWSDTAVPVRAAALDVVLRRLPEPGRTFALGIDRPLYFSVHSAVAQLTTGGAALVSVARYRRPDDNDGPGAVRAELEQVLDLVQPGWRSELLDQRFLPGLTVVGNEPRASTGGLDGRPGPLVPGAPGLLVAGDWVGPAGMLADAAVASGAAAGNIAAAVPSATEAVA